MEELKKINLLAEIRNFISERYNPNPQNYIILQDNETLTDLANRQSFVSMIVVKEDVNNYIKANYGMTFSQKLLFFMREKGIENAQTLYKAAYSSRQIWSNIMNQTDYKPKKETAICYALALELNRDETDELLGAAGYCLTNSDKRDIAIMYFIDNGIFDIPDVDEILKEMDLKQLSPD